MTVPTRQIVRLLACLAISAAATFAAIAPTSAQVAPPALPPIPPLPEETRPVLAVLGPITSPACGTALFVAGLAPGLAASVPEPFRSLIAPTLLTTFSVCASIPIPPGSTQLVCAADDQLAAIIGTAVDRTLGAGLPVPLEPRVVGPLVEVTVIGENTLPEPLKGLGGAELLRDGLACRYAKPAPTGPDAETPPPPQPVPTTPAAPIDQFDYSIGLAPLAPLPAPLVTPPTGGLQADPTPSLQPIAGVTTTLPYSHPIVFVLPLLVMAVASYVARNLTGEIALPQRLEGE